MTENTRKYEAAKILLQVSREISSSLDLEKVSEIVLDQSSKALGADHASLFLMDETIRKLMLTKAKGFSADELDNINLLGSWEIINENVIKSKEPLIVNDIRDNFLFKGKKLPFADIELPIHSFLAVPLEVEGKIIGILIVSNRKRPGHLFTEEDKELLEALSNNIAIALLNAKLYHRLKNLFISTVTSLARAIDAKDAYTSGHSERVMKYAVAIGQELNLDEETLENLRLASILHDIGKIGVPDNILLKPEELTEEEWQIMKKHPIFGYKLLKKIHFLEEASEISCAGKLKTFANISFPLLLKGVVVGIAIFFIMACQDLSTT
ncbi:MAG: GAF domain-containing protein, partial [Candidatus Omnitrophica bacterium]|nr:GAF domain-containing protein [Candidatus Omnitrophota bacterium]